MLIFENKGEIDPRLISLIGVNVKVGSSPIGHFGTGLKYAVACMARWGEELRVQSGANEFFFEVEEQSIRGKDFGILHMRSRRDRLQLGFTTELGKNWEPWMVYRELWCNAQDEPKPCIYEADVAPAPKPGLTRLIAIGSKLALAHSQRDDFILNREAKKLLHDLDGLEIFEGECSTIFYRGIAVQSLSKPAMHTYNITRQLWLTEDRTAGSWATDPIIAKGLTQIKGPSAIDKTLLAPVESFESRLDYSEIEEPGQEWLERAEIAFRTQPLSINPSVRQRFQTTPVRTCPTCGRAM